jgi:hypothetical protein
LVDGAFHAGWDRYGSDVTSFANQIDNRPAILSLLNVFDYQMDKFRSPQSAAEQDGQHGSIPLAAD